jgi:peptidase E
MTRHIIAMGGGGFSMEPDNLALDRYVLNQTTERIPKICFLPTATGDSDRYILNFYKAFSTLECRPSYLSLFQPPTTDLEDYVLEKDVLYVGGGNTRSMLALWREWEMDKILRKAYDAGIILAGVSAGANCWFQQCSTDSVPGQLTMLPALGFLPGSFCPHYDAEADRRPSFQQLLREDKILPGYAADDGAALHFVDENVFKAVSSRPSATVYHVSKKDEQIVENALEMAYLAAQ